MEVVRIAAGDTLGGESVGNNFDRADVTVVVGGEDARAANVIQVFVRVYDGDNRLVRYARDRLFVKCGRLCGTAHGRGIRSPRRRMADGIYLCLLDRLLRRRQS